MKRRTQVLLSAFLLCGAMVYLNAQQTPDTQGQGAQQTQPSQQPGQAQPSQPGQAYPGQQPPASTQPTQPGTETPGSQASTSQGVQTFTGTIEKSGDKYVLKDESTGKTYDIDHQDLVGQHVGKRVRVNGTLDPSGSMIHIQPANH